MKTLEVSLRLKPVSRLLFYVQQAIKHRRITTAQNGTVPSAPHKEQCHLNHMSGLMQSGLIVIISITALIVYSHKQWTI